MACTDKNMQRLLDKKVAGECSENELARIETHSSECRECRETLKYLEKMASNLKAEIRAPGDITGNIMRKVRNLENRAIPRLHARRWFKPVLSLEAAFIMLFIIAIMVARKPADTVLVKFSLALPEASEVHLVGDFNDWDENAHRLKKKDGVWVTELRLQPARYQYIFLVDGKKWIADPRASENIDDGYGNKNSIIDLKKTLVDMT